MKGLVTGLEMVIIAVVVLLFVVMVVALPIIALKVHLVEVVNYENNYNNAQLGLLTILSTTDRSGTPVSEIITGYLVLNEPNNLNVVKEKLDKLFDCYELRSGTDILVENGQCNLEYTASAKIALPYGRFDEIITLAIG